MVDRTSSLAKLSRPRLYRPLRRTRLFELLDSHAKQPLLWVCGPPGAGKTTLVATWLDEGATPALWYHADPGDRDPGAFFAYLTELVAAHRSSRRTLPVFGPEHERDTSAFARLFFRRLFALLPAGTALVIDNHHDASSNAFDALLRDASGEVPDGRQLVVVSRAEVPPALSRALANQSVGRIGWEELRLTEAESEQLLRAQGDSSPTTRAAELHRLCGGWAAGLILMGRSTRALPSVAAESEGVALFDYFAAEVLEGIADEDRAVLLTTAAFPQFTAAMAAQISGHASPGAVLERLSERQYFTERRVAKEVSFRYHDLFRDFLQTQARQTLGDAGWKTTLDRAANILFDRGEADAAIDCLRAARNWVEVGNAVATHARSLLAQGRWRTVLRWLDEIPDTTLTANPWLQYWKGSARAGSDPPGGRVILEQAFATFAASADAAGQLTTCAAILKSFFTEDNIGPAADRWIEATERSLSSECTVPALERQAALPALVQSILKRMPTNPRLPEYAREVERDLRVSVDPNERLGKATMLVYYLDEMGEFERAALALERIEEDLANEDALPLNRCLGWYMHAYHAYLVGDFKSARHAQSKGICLAREFGIGQVEHLLWVSQAMTLLANGELAPMQRVRGELLRVLVPQIHQHALSFAWIDLWFALVAEDLGEARRIWDSFSRLPPAGVPIYATYNHAVVWFLCIEGKTSVAIERIERWRRPLSGIGSDWNEFNFRAMEACAFLHLPDPERLDAALRAMMALGQRHQYRNLCTWIPRMAATLCSAAWERGIETEYVRWLVGIRSLDPPMPDTPHWPRAIEVRTLGAFEIRLLGKPAEFGQKSPKRPLALLKAVIAAGPAGLSTERASELLWSELDGDAAAEALAAALYRLRKLLGEADALHLNDGRIALDARKVWVDAFAFEHLADHADEQTQDYALALYRGPFLPLDETESWSIAMRDRMRARFTTLVARRANALERNSRFDEGIACYRAGIGADPLAETLYQGLMRCHLALGRRAEGASVYRQLRQTLSVILGIAPSTQSESLGRALLSQE